MKKLTTQQALQPLQKGHIRLSIRYKETDYLMTFDGIFNPDRNLNPIKMILRKRAPKPLPVSTALDHVSMSPAEVENNVAGAI